MLAVAVSMVAILDPVRLFVDCVLPTATDVVFAVIDEVCRLADDFSVPSNKEIEFMISSGKEGVMCINYPCSSQYM